MLQGLFPFVGECKAEPVGNLERGVDDGVRRTGDGAGEKVMCDETGIPVQRINSVCTQIDEMMEISGGTDANVNANSTVEFPPTLHVEV